MIHPIEALGSISSTAMALIFASSITSLASAAPSVEKFRKDFRELGFEMFIHYNMATYHGVQWVDGYPSPSTFNPGGPIDTDAWADAAKSAGMTYAVLTAKHVAGFCLWDSKHTTYDVMHPDCPVKEDLVAKFIKSFTSRGLKVGLYYCWRSPGFADKYKGLPPECDPAEHGLATQIDFQKKTDRRVGGESLLDKSPARPKRRTSATRTFSSTSAPTIKDASSTPASKPSSIAGENEFTFFR